MIHAVLTQQPLVVQLQHRLRIAFVYMTDHERFGRQASDYTEDCYHAAVRASGPPAIGSREGRIGDPGRLMAADSASPEVASAATREP